MHVFWKKKNVIARSLTLVPIESAYPTSYTVINSSFANMLSLFRDIADFGENSYAIPNSPEFWDVPLELDCHVGALRSKDLKLIICAISFEVTQPIWHTPMVFIRVFIINITDGQMSNELTTNERTLNTVLVHCSITANPMSKFCYLIDFDRPRIAISIIRLCCEKLVIRDVKFTFLGIRTLCRKHNAGVHRQATQQNSIIDWCALTTQFPPATCRLAWQHTNGMVNA